MARSRGQPRLVNRIVSAALLSGNTYREIARDSGATGQALLVFAVATIAVGIGGLHAGFTGLVVGLVASLIAWLVYAVAVYWIGTAAFGAPRSPGIVGALVRTLGFASAPRALLFLGFIPVIGIIIGAIAILWTLVTTIIAIQESMRLDFGGAFVTAFLGWIALFIGSFLITAML